MDKELEVTQRANEISEFVENNVLTVLCRIIERDAANKHVALETLEHILWSGQGFGTENLYQIIAKECRIERLMGQVVQAGDENS